MRNRCSKRQATKLCIPNSPKNTNHLPHVLVQTGKGGWKPVFKEKPFAQQIIAPVYGRQNEAETVVQIMMRKNMEPQTMEVFCSNDIIKGILEANWDEEWK